MRFMQIWIEYPEESERIFLHLKQEVFLKLLPRLTNVSIEMHVLVLCYSKYAFLATRMLSSRAIYFATLFLSLLCILLLLCHPSNR